MALSTEELETALIDATCQVYDEDPDAVSVKKVRRCAELKLRLQDDFFVSDEWKQTSKTIIKQYVNKLLDGWTRETKQDPDPNPGLKRASSDAESPDPKRRKRTSSSGKCVKKQSKASTIEHKSKADKNAGPRYPRKKASEKKASAGVEVTSIASPVSSTERVFNDKRAPEDGNQNAAKQDEPKDGDAQTKTQAEPESEHKFPEQKKSETDSKYGFDEVQKLDTAQENEEEYSDVIDKPVKPRHKSKNGKADSKASRPVSKKASPPTLEDADDVEVKRLQSQLSKCGIRKLWHNELKKYGDDSRAKIQHLKKMLADIGMKGRFSEAKAREIKETRELMAEAEAAQEMNRLWGMRSQERASRSKSKSRKCINAEASDADEDKVDAVVDCDGTTADDDDEGNTFAARRRRAQADLAFLGDDSDSD